MYIAESGGNIVFPKGNALKYLGKYFLRARTIRVSVDGSVLKGNIYKTGILEIIKNYTDHIKR